MYAFSDCVFKISSLVVRSLEMYSEKTLKKRIYMYFCLFL